jgi:hypothetical protein
MQTLDVTLSKTELTAIWKVLDPKKLGYAELPDIHQFLSDKYGKDKTSTKNQGVIERVLKRILERCGENAGIKGLARTLSIMDNSGDKRLSKEELK